MELMIVIVDNTGTIGKLRVNYIENLLTHFISGLNRLRHGSQEIYPVKLIFSGILTRFSQKLVVKQGPWSWIFDVNPSCNELCYFSVVDCPYQ